MTTENNATLRVADNHVTLAGLLVEKTVEPFELADGRSAISAELTIETGKDEQHKVKMFSMKEYQDRETKEMVELRGYKAITTIGDEYKAIADEGVGRENADIVEVIKNNNPKYANAVFGLNEYHGEQGLVSFPEISVNHIERVKDKSQHSPHAKFEVEAVVASATEEVKDDEPTGRAILKTYISVNDKGVTRVIPFEFKVNEDGSSYVLDNYEKGNTVFVYGDIINKSEKTVRKVEAAFGADKEDVSYKTVREYVISGGSEAYEEEDSKAFNLETIAKGLTEREVHLEGLKTKHEQKGKSGGKKGGFDTSKKKTKSRSVEEAPLPF